jgi:hypothetical protein
MLSPPTWFLGVDAAFNAVFFLVALIVTVLGFRCYRFCKEERYKLHTTGFLFLSASYLALGLTSLVLFLDLRQQTYTLRELLHLARFTQVGSTLYVLFFLVGLIFLLIVYLNVKERAIRLLLFVLTLFSVLLAHSVRSTFYVLASILLLFIIVKLWQHWRERCKAPALLVLLGFSCLLVGEVLLTVLSIPGMGESLYVAASAATLAGFLLIIASLVRK